MVNNKINVNVIDGLQPILDRVVDYDNITNCITEIPQDIKLELNNGTLTLKAGSKIYVPNGTGKFDDVVVDTDRTLTINWGTANDEMLLFLEVATGKLTRINLPRIVSGATNTYIGDISHIWYNTSTNKINWINSDQSLGAQLSLPIAKFIALGKENGTETPKVTSIDQVFNGVGYIGSTVFILPGVKGLISDGWNADGTYNNMISQLKSVYTNTFTDTNSTRALCLMMNNVGGYASGGMEEVDILPTSPVGMRRYYLKSKNEWFWWQNGAWTTDHLVKLADIVTESGVIKSLKPQLPFRAVDQNYFNKLDEEVAALDAQNVKLTGYQTIGGVKRFNAAHIEVQNTGTSFADSKTGQSYINFWTGDNKQTGYINSYLNANTTSTSIGAVGYDDAGNQKSWRLNIYRNLDNSGGYAALDSSPATTDNSTKIATTAFFRNNMQVVETLPSTATNGVFYFVKE